MIDRQDIARIYIGPRTLGSVIKPRARNAEIGGTSHVRKRPDRMGNLRRDQETGMIGNYAGNLLLTGDLETFERSRDRADRDPFKGDGGEDVPGWNVDVKASEWRNEAKNLMDYHLAVRPAERHEGTRYVQVIVQRINHDPPCAIAHVMGWALESDLPSVPKKRGPLAGTYAVRCRDLRPLSSLKRGTKGIERRK